MSVLSVSSSVSLSSSPSFSTAVPDVIQPVRLVVAQVLAVAHDLLTGLGLDPAGGATWVAAIAAVVVAVRLALLPVVAHGVRTARAAARARPALTELRARYAGRRDPDSLRALAAEQRAIQAEHGLSPLGCLPALLQLPILFALYGVLSAVAAGRPVGAMDAALVASAGSASWLGVRLAYRAGGLFASPAHLGVVVLLAGTSAALSYATQRWFTLPNTSLEGLPEAMVGVQRYMPAVSAAGILVSAAVVPVGLLVYWVASNAWILAQTAAIARWWPTPGTVAHHAWAARRAAAGDAA